MKIYIITEGDYSDHRIIGATADLAEAEAFTADYNVCGASAEIEAYESDDLLPDGAARPNRPWIGMWKQGLRPFIATMRRDGTNETITTASPRNEVVFWSLLNWRYPPVADVHLRVHCWAQSKEHAAKIANEVRTRIIALNLWPADAPADWLKRVNDRKITSVELVLPV